MNLTILKEVSTAMALNLFLVFNGKFYNFVATSRYRRIVEKLYFQVLLEKCQFCIWPYLTNSLPILMAFIN